MGSKNKRRYVTARAQSLSRIHEVEDASSKVCEISSMDVSQPRSITLYVESQMTFLRSRKRRN